MGTTSTHHKHDVTAEQLAACTRCVDPSGAIYYRVQSRTDAETVYIVTAKSVTDGLGNTHRVIVCDQRCKAATNGLKCWHCRAVQAHSREYHEMQRCYVVSETALTSRMSGYYVQQNGRKYYGVQTRSGYTCECDHFACKHGEAVAQYRTRQAERQLSAA